MAVVVARVVRCSCSVGVPYTIPPCAVDYHPADFSSFLQIRENSLFGKRALSRKKGGPLVLSSPNPILFVGLFGTLQKM